MSTRDIKGTVENNPKILEFLIKKNLKRANLPVFGAKFSILIKGAISEVVPLDVQFFVIHCDPSAPTTCSDYPEG